MKKKPVPVHRFHVAIPEDLWQRLQKAADQNRRSVTRQILCAIDWTTRTFKEDGDESAKSPG